MDRAGQDRGGEKEGVQRGDFERGGVAETGSRINKINKNQRKVDFTNTEWLD